MTHLRKIMLEEVGEHGEFAQDLQSTGLSDASRGQH
jgi:hypothetical protein